MATMISEVYDALLDAGASEEKARRAAETLASYDSEFHRIDMRLERIEGRIRLLQWQVAAIFALIGVLTVPTLWLVLRVATKVGALPT